MKLTRLFLTKMTKRFKLLQSDHMNMSQLHQFMPNVGTTSSVEEGYMRIRMEADKLSVIVKTQEDKLDKITGLMKIQKEKLAFLRIKDELKKDKSMVGKFVAIHNGVVVDSDDDDLSLMKRVYDKFGYTPILITQLGEETKVIIHSPQSNIY